MHFICTYSVLLTYTAGILEIACPCQTQGSHFEIPICEHISQTECVVVFLCNKANVSIINLVNYCFV